MLGTYNTLGERKFSLGLDCCIIGGKRTPSKFLITIYYFGLPRKKNKSHAFPMIQIYDSLAFSVSLCIVFEFKMTTLAFQHF